MDKKIKINAQQSKIIGACSRLLAGKEKEKEKITSQRLAFVLP
jgi:hypothetical protein